MPSNEQRRRAAKRKLERQLARRAERAKRRRLIGIAVTLVAVVLVGLGVWYLASRPSTSDAAQASSTTASTPINIPTALAPAPKRPTPLPATVQCDYPASGTAAKPVKAPPTNNISATGVVNVTLKTTAGDIPLVLDRSLAPCAVNNFISLANQGYYDNTPCPRLSTSGLQMLQCGDPTGSGQGGPGYTFKDEVWSGLTYGRGYLAMANAGPDTNGSQFFLVYGNAQLDPAYTVFGSISQPGLQVLDTIARAGDDGSLDPNPGGGAPNQKVTITKAAVGS